MLNDIRRLWAASLRKRELRDKLLRQQAEINEELIRRFREEKKRPT
jgi:hypothetical protein